MLTRCPFSPELRGKRGFAFAACKALVRFTSWIVNADRANSSLDRGDSSQALRRHRARHFMDRRKSREDNLMLRQVKSAMERGHKWCGLTGKQGERIVFEMEVQQI
jgi:hypothetical protein